MYEKRIDRGVREGGKKLEQGQKCHLDGIEWEQLAGRKGDTEEKLSRRTSTLEALEPLQGVSNTSQI